MFTGLVEELGTLRAVSGVGRSLHLMVGARTVLEGLRLGDSIAVNGCCLTVVRFDGSTFTADVMPETYEKTNLASLRPGDRVNLERTMRLGDRFGGHIVQGHVDGTGRVERIVRDEIAVRVTMSAPADIMRYLVPKGSVTIDGISLTVVATAPGQFEVSIIPHTAAMTTIGARKAGDVVNLEVDILAKYVEKMLSARLGGEHRTGDPAGTERRPGVTAEFLAEHGFK